MENSILQSNYYRAGNKRQSMPIVIDEDEIIGYNSITSTTVFRGRFGDNLVCVVKRFQNLSNERANRILEKISPLINLERHQNIAKYFEISRAASLLNLETVEGKHFLDIAIEIAEYNLEKFIEDCTFDKLAINIQIANGVQFLHSRNIIHLNLKPKNILIKFTPNESENYNVLITDYNSNDKLYPNLWSAPELLKSGRKADLKIDIFALGCVFHFVESKGKHPYGSLSSTTEERKSSGNYVLDMNDIVLEQLIELMISPDSRIRISIDGVLKHPYFMHKDEKIEFFSDINERLSSKNLPDSLVSRLEYQIGKFDWRQHKHTEAKFKSSQKPILSAIRYFSKKNVAHICPLVLIKTYEIACFFENTAPDWFNLWYGKNNAMVLVENFYRKQRQNLVISKVRILPGFESAFDVKFTSWCPNTNILMTAGTDGVIIFWTLWNSQGLMINR